MIRIIEVLALQGASLQGNALEACT